MLQGISTMRTELLRFNGAVKRDPAIDAWMKEHAGELGAIAHQWFEVMRKCGDEVRELLHDGYPIACLGDAPFGYVDVFTSHVNVGFFHGAALPDPAHLLQGTGKFMGHVKLRPGTATNTAALSRLIETILGYKGAHRKRLSLAASSLPAFAAAFFRSPNVVIGKRYSTKMLSTVSRSFSQRFVPTSNPNWSR